MLILIQRGIVWVSGRGHVSETSGRSLPGRRSDEKRVADVSYMLDRSNDKIMGHRK